MPQYRKYPDVKDMPSRKARKAQRHKIFEENKLAGNRERAERRKTKKELLNG